MRLLWLLTVVAVATAAAQDCGTCDSLGYSCIGAAALRDNCGAVIDPATCPIPSCPAFCQSLGQPTEWATCNDATHLCTCSAPLPTLPSPAPAPLPPACVPLTCASAAAAGYQCLPPTDPCTGRALVCPGGRASCATQCNNPLNALACNATTHRCDCTPVVRVQSNPAPTPRPASTGQSSSPAKTGSIESVDAPVAIAAVPTATVLERDGEISMSSTTIAATCVVAAVGLLGLIAVCVFAGMHGKK